MAFLGKSLLSARKTVSIDTLNFKSPLLLYFAASWCPLSKNFTPTLKDFYNNVNSQSKQCEIVFASLCRTDLDFSDFYGRMPWLAIPYQEKTLLTDLTKKFNIKKIPALILVGEDGSVLFSECKKEVETKGVEAIPTFNLYLNKKT